MSSEGEMLTLDDAAVALGVTRPTVYQWIAWGWLTKTSVYDLQARRRKTAIPRRQIDELNAKRERGEHLPAPPSDS